MLSKKEFDIIIPVHKKDLAVLEYCIKAAREKIIGARRIIIISKERYSDNAEWFAEENFPFNIEFVRSYVGGSAGWYFQQLLKFYAPFVVPDILEDVLILDSDTVFFRKVKMFDSQNRPYYNIGKDKDIANMPFSIRVDEHIKKIFPEISRRNLPKEFKEISGICHMMMFQRKILSDLFRRVEEYDKTGDEFYKIFLKHATEEYSVSEYQIYFNFLLIYYRQNIVFRKLNYKNTADLNIKKYRHRFKYHYCSFHSYMRSNVKNKCFDKILKKLFFVEIRNIGIANCNISQFINIPNQKIKWLASSILKGCRTSSFGLITDDGKKYIFFKKYEKKGNISVLELDQNLQIIAQKTAFETNERLSCPYIFNYDKKNYAIVVNYKEKKVILYKILPNLEFRKVKSILENIDATDSSIIFYKNKFWLFFNQFKDGNNELFLAYSDDLFGEWEMHPQNPVKRDIASAGGAGEIFIYGQNLYRPAQNCLKTYGGSVKLNKIKVLDSENYSEVEEIEITPNQIGPYPDGLQIITKLGENHTVINGKKMVFMPYKFLLSLYRIIHKILKKRINLQKSL